MHRSIAITIGTAALLATAVAGIAHAGSAAQRFTFTGKTIRGHDLPISVSATGAITARGTAQMTERPKTTVGAFRFPNGRLDMRFVHGATQAHPDPAKCRATIDARGTYTIGGGTGRYARATGRGDYTETRLLIGARDAAGACITNPNAVPASVTVVATMVGTVALG